MEAGKSNQNNKETLRILEKIMELIQEGRRATDYRYAQFVFNEADASCKSLYDMLLHDE